MVALDASQVGVHVQLAGPGQHSALEGVGRDQSKGGGCSILAKKAPVPEEQATMRSRFKGADMMGRDSEPERAAGRKSKWRLGLIASVSATD